MNITVVYPGASGGFMLYYWLLLSGRFQVTIPSALDMISRQFPPTLAQDRRSWKSYEISPHDQPPTPGPRVSLVCNPLFDPGMLDRNRAVINTSHAILLTAPFRAQLRMAYEKQAYWFTPVSRRVFRADSDQRRYLRWIIGTQKQGLDPQVSGILQEFRIDQVLDLRDLLDTGQVPGQPLANQHQRRWLQRWWDLQSPRTQRLL